MPLTCMPPPPSVSTLIRRCVRSPSCAIASSLALATLVALADYWTGDRFPLAICYLPSILVVCWVSHLALGVCLAMACSTAWLIDDLLFIQNHSVTLEQCWTALTHFGFYVVIMTMLMRVRSAHEREEWLARNDHLTGLMNRKAFREDAKREIERSRRTGLPVAVAYIDCDNFKEINDRRGHFEGDQVLVAVGSTIFKNVRLIDSAGRMGGDEFAVLLPGATLETAQRVVDRLRSKLDQQMQIQDWPVTFSIGVMVFSTAPDSVDELIHRSDLLMLSVKRQGKNTVVYELCD